MATNKAQGATTSDKAAQATATTTPSPRTPHSCACLAGTGKTCPDTTMKAFHQGHDARLSSRVAQAIAAGSMTEEAGLKLVKDAGGSDLLISKTKHSADLRKAKAATPSEPKTPAASRSKSGPKATASQAAAMTKAAPSVIGTKMKVAHGGKQVDAVVVRNASDELVARHRVQGRNVDHPVTVTESKDGPVVKVTE